MYEVLKQGNSGDSVKILQEKLKILGFYNAIITGEFGAATTEGVKAFQSSIGLDPTGIVDNNTWEKIIQYTEPAIAKISIYPTLGLGSTGSYVTDLQTKLKALLYYTKDISGDFDLETENAVKRFQLNNKITADGKVGSQTWNLINSLYGNLNDCAINSESNNNSTYTVQSGDTLYSIAKKFNTTVDELKNLNNLTNNTINIGQIIKIPTKASDNYIKYYVQNGDTLYSIARKYNTTVDEIKSLNNLTSNILQIGQVLNIPTSNTEDYINYIVQSGDTLYSIANKYNTSIDTIKSLNSLTSNTLLVGQVLKLPTSAGTNYVSYTVKNGDTLYSIAKRYNTSVNEIKSFNNLSSNTLNIGQTLNIPV